MLGFLFLQADKNSAAYQAGQWFGRILIFAVVFTIVVWLARRFFGKKK